MSTLVPPRPLRLSNRFVGKTLRTLMLFALGGLLAGGAILVWQGFTLVDLVGQRRIWREGAVAHDVSFEGKHRSRLFFHSYDLTVHYTDEEEVHHAREVEFHLLGVDAESDTMTVRYDPRAPYEIAVSWAHDHAGALWGNSLFFVAVGLIFAGLLLQVTVIGLRQFTRARAAARSSEEVRAEIVETKPILVRGRPHGTRFTLRYRRSDGTEVTFKENLEQGLAPMKDGEQVVALLAPDARHPVVVAEGGYPFELAARG